MKKYIMTVYFKSGKVETINIDETFDIDELIRPPKNDNLFLMLDECSLIMPIENIDYIKVEKEGLE